MAKCKSDMKGFGKKPSKTSKKTMKKFPFFMQSPPSNTPGSNEPGPGPGPQQ